MSTTCANDSFISLPSLRQIAPSSRFSLTVNSGITDFPSDTCEIPKRTNFSGLSAVIVCPFQLTTPEVGLFNPDNARSKVVFPAPLDPMIAARPPVGTASET